jgi:hypothetical protein
MEHKKITPELTPEQKLNLETAKIGWQELQRFFAQGLIVVVDSELDLLDIAGKFVTNDSDSVESLLSDGRVYRAETEDAKKWNTVNGDFWAVVVAPWVLVQEINPL